MNDLKDYKTLLKQADQWYQMYEAGRSDPFNVFSVLRKESDEVNLHSRFLAALLDHRKWRHAPRENLKDFLEKFVEGKFEDDGATVDREHDDIDILIANKKTKQAVAIENKINAPRPTRTATEIPRQIEGERVRQNTYAVLDASWPRSL